MGIASYQVITSRGMTNFVLTFASTGYQEGGEFNALISIKVKDKTQLDEIKAK